MTTLLLNIEVLIVVLSVLFDIISGSEELKSLISSQCKAPDHSVVSLELKISSCTEVADNLAKRSKSIRKYSFYNPNVNFLNNAVWNSAVTETINQLENQILLNTEFDKLYGNLVKMILNEMDNYLEFRDVSKSNAKKYKCSKPYWNNTLHMAWSNMIKSEKNYKKYHGHRNVKSRLRVVFLSAREYFDKLLRKSEREYNKNVVINIENMSKHNHRDFWRKIKSLGPGKSEIPFKVMHNGIITTDIVLDTWKNDFEKLYNPSLENMDVAFANEIEKQKHDLENDREAEFQTTLNTHILLEEVEKAISHCKNNKAPGIDQIPNEVIKTHP